MSSTSRALFAGSTALVLAASGTTLLASSATAATSGELAYTCSSPDLGTFPVTAQHTFTDFDDSDDPATEDVTYGGWLRATTVLELPGRVVRDLRDSGATDLAGRAATRATLAGVAIESSQGIDKAPVPGSGPMELVAVGEVNIDPASGTVNAGDTADLSLADIDGSDLTAQLATYRDGTDGPDTTPVECDMADGQDLSGGPVQILQAYLRPRLALGYVDRTGKVVGYIGVGAPSSAATPTGDMTLVLKRNGVRIDAVTVPLKGGVAVIRTVSPKKGTYRLVTRFHDNQNFVGGRDTLTETFS